MPLNANNFCCENSLFVLLGNLICLYIPCWIGRVRIYKTIILPVVLCGCETGSLTLRGENRLGVFENRMLRRTFGPKRDVLIGDRRKIHNKLLGRS
jgi:hypothetical protein